jgi:(aminoalkyl)phosphonate N-acetyltransferase
MSYLIRPAEEKDILRIYHFICLLEEINFDYAAFEIIFRKNITNKDNYYLVAESANDGLIGFISCHTQYLLHHCGKVAEIQELYIDDKYRQMGIGRDLLNKTEKEFIQKDCISFEVTAQNKREATHRFYESAGFACTHKKFVKPLT